MYYNIGENQYKNHSYYSNINLNNNFIVEFKSCCVLLFQYVIVSVLKNKIICNIESGEIKKKYCESLLQACSSHNRSHLGQMYWGNMLLMLMTANISKLGKKNRPEIIKHIRKCTEENAQIIIYTPCMCILFFTCS